MTSRDFAFWLQGYLEVANPETINKEQLKVIKNHLNLVFKHEIDPSMGNQNHQNELNAIHSEGASHLFPNENDIHLRC